MRYQVAFGAGLLIAALLTVGLAFAQAPNTSETNVHLVAGPIPQTVQQNTATIWWETDRPSSSVVKYGNDPNNLSQTAQQPWGAQSHKIDLNNLQPDQTYYAKVFTSDGREMGSTQFKTLPSNYGSVQFFRISQGPVVQYLGDTTATINWTTNAPSSAIVKYGTSPGALNQQAEAPWGPGQHSVKLQNLTPNTTYYVQVVSTQAQGSGASVESQTFTLTTVPKGQSAYVFPQQ